MKPSRCYAVKYECPSGRSRLLTSSLSAYNDVAGCKIGTYGDYDCCPRWFPASAYLQVLPLLFLSFQKSDQFIAAATFCTLRHPVQIGDRAGLRRPARRAFLSLSTTSMPETTLPITVYWPLRNEASPRQMKELRVARFGSEARAIPTTPRTNDVGVNSEARFG